MPESTYLHISKSSSKGTWHRAMQDLFEKEYQEVKFTVKEVNNEQVTQRTRYADVHKDDKVIEFQHSPILRIEVNNRNKDYESTLGKQVVWVIDCTENTHKPEQISKEDDIWLLHFEKKWHVESMRDCKILFADFGDYGIFRVPPAHVKNMLVKVHGSWKKDINWISHLTSDIDPEFPIPKQTTITIAQDPHGSGKTYELTRMPLHTHLPQYAKYNQYDIFIYVTKPHSAKEVVYKEFINHMKNLDFKYTSQKVYDKFYVIEFTRSDNNEIRIIMGTVDSLMYNLSTNKLNGTDMFINLVRTIHQYGPNKLKGHKGKFNYAGEQPYLNSRTLLIGDECTMLSEDYKHAFSTLVTMCNVDLHLAGDVQQSTYMENNVLTSIISEYNEHGICPSFPNSKVEVKIGNTVRRFNQDLVNFRNTVMEGFHNNPSHNLNIPIPVAATDIPHVRGEYSIHIYPINETVDKNDKIDIEVECIMEHFKKDVYEHNLLPKDIIIITPFVTNNVMVDALQSRIHGEWATLLSDADYVETIKRLRPTEWKELEQYLAQTETLPWLAILHRSESNRPIDTSTSKYATRIVSIHASQGDGRDVSYVVGLTESGLKKHSDGKINIKYESLLNVSISRMKKQIRVFLQPCYDDIWARFEPLIDKKMKYSLPQLVAKTKFRCENIESGTMDPELFNDIKNDILSKNACVESERVLVDYNHHIVRYAIPHTMICAKLCYTQSINNLPTEQVLTLFSKIANARIESVDSINKYFNILFNNCHDHTVIPVIYYKTSRYNFQNIYQIFIKRLEHIQTHVKQWVKGNTTDVHKLTPADMVVLQYAVEAFTKGVHTNVKYDNVYDIIHAYTNPDELSNNNLKNHYDYLTHVDLLFDNIIGDETMWRWTIFRSTTLGNKKLGNQTQYFQLQNNIEHLLVTESCAIPVIICTIIDEANIGSLVAKAVIAHLFCSQPEKKQYNNGKGTPVWELIDGKQVKICIAPLNTSKPLFINISNIIEDKIALVADWLSAHVQSQAEFDFPIALRLANHYKDNFEDAQDMVGSAFQKGKCPEYMREAIFAVDGPDQFLQMMTTKLTEHLRFFKRDIKKR